MDNEALMQQLGDTSALSLPYSPEAEQSVL